MIQKNPRLRSIEHMLPSEIKTNVARSKQFKSDVRTFCYKAETIVVMYLRDKQMQEGKMDAKTLADHN